MKPTIKWNAEKFGVEIQTKGQHFAIDANPSMVMQWNDAVRFYKDNKEWRLPSREELLLVAANIDDVNAIIKKNGGHKMEGWFWASYEYNEFCAWRVPMGSGGTGNSSKNYGSYVRAVSALNN